MAFHHSQRIAERAIEAGEKKASLPVGHALLLGFLGGAFISLGFLLDIRVIANLPEEWGSFSSFLGASIFPLGLILIVIAGGELLTGNMMVLPIAVFAGRATAGQLLNNWLLILVSNFVGAIFVAYFFGHIVGLTEAGAYLTKTVSIAESKLNETFIQSFISAVGCNWLVCLAVWMAFGADDISGKLLAIWFPVMAFVAIGFQHVVANMFVIPAAIFAGHLTWGDYFTNFIPVLLGNALGGTLFVAFIYWKVHKNSLEVFAEEKPKIKKAG
ncbi:formate/nitrite transporter family protein [Niallia oryzisoli]|uniref:formate/nitrite transporter family protein n=1 Tax=Niallia oryzisoli TaxID=1737571 RepID=UPI0037357F5B